MRSPQKSAATNSPQRKTGPASLTKSPQSRKRKRTVLSIQQKQNIIDRLDQNERPISLAEEFGISQQQVSDIKKNRDRILEFVGEMDDSSLRRKTIKTSNDPSIEKLLFRWYASERDNGTILTSEQLQKKAVEIYDESKDPKDPPFKASAGWLRGFKTRYGIQSDPSDGKLGRGSPSRKGKKASGSSGNKMMSLAQRVVILEDRLEDLEKTSRAKIALLEEQLEDILTQSPSKRGKRLVTKV